MKLLSSLSGFVNAAGSLRFGGQNVF